MRATILTALRLAALVAASLAAAASPAAAAPGHLAYDGCVADAAPQGCADLPFSPLQAPIGVAVSPDGRSV